MKQIRIGVFETNSSSTHSLTICTEEEYRNWVDGKTIKTYENRFLPMPENYPHDNEGAEESYREYCNTELNTFNRCFTTPSGDKMAAFGQYGYDG